MNKKDLLALIFQAENELKDFQAATVNNVYTKLYEEGQSRHLVADEVGLGKTIVAKGLVAKAMKAHLLSNKLKPFKVIYICSNQALASQNLKKINIFKDPKFEQSTRGRLIFEALIPENNERFQLQSLTPSTSFNIKKGYGIQEERMLLWLLLSEYPSLNEPVCKMGLKLMLMGSVINPDNWIESLNYYKNSNPSIRADVYKKFFKVIEKELIDLDNWYNFHIKNELKRAGKVPLIDIMCLYSKKLKRGSVKNHYGPGKLLGRLRHLLTEICLDYLDADLFILDEFQRFKSLIVDEKDNQSEASAIAEKVFGIPKSKVLLLSATPFKAYTSSLEQEIGNENHFEEFEALLKFLFKNSAEKLEVFYQNRKVFFDYLRRPEKLEGITPDCKEVLENLYREVISRTERLLVSDDKNTLVRISNSTMDVLRKEDILDFHYADRIVQNLNEFTNGGLKNMVEYTKSSPYPFSFLDNYKEKEELKKLLKSTGSNKKKLKDVIEANKDGWIDLHKVQDYKPLDLMPNPKLRSLLNICIDNGMWKQLWLAPSLPYYELVEAFKEAENNSKILIFSKWKMVPKAVASIVSYEAERASIGSLKVDNADIDPDIVYFPPFIDLKKDQTRKPRKPTKKLQLSIQKGNPKMSAFTLLYPSLSLAKAYEIRSNVKKNSPLSLNKLKLAIASEVKKLIRDAGLKNYCKGKAKTENWYWTAPLLLDKFYYKEKYDNWLIQKGYKTSVFVNGHQENAEDNEKSDYEINKTRLKHLEELEKVYKDPDIISLGAFPDDLVEVLTLMVLASPAVASLRTLAHHFIPKKENQNESASVQNKEILSHSLDISYEFFTLFDKPEAIAVVQLHSKKLSAEEDGKNVYWHDVLNYCVSGNLQSVLDEFGHLISADFKDIKSFSERLAGSVNTRTSNVKVDSAESFLNQKAEFMRCHFAVDFGNQNMEMDTGINRINTVLESFNSPFRPFVLASTSVGQEGLDFHYYCRKVMHWNLPSNAIDIEQREGRVNRFKGLVIRQNLVVKYRKFLVNDHQDSWEHLFKIALEEGKASGKPELVPFWHIEGNGIFIERIVPVFPFSKDINILNSLLATLTIYRLTFGQPRQEELVNSLYSRLTQDQLEDVRNKMMINLSPISF